MDNSLISPYSQALNAHKAQLEGYLDTGFKTIAVPAHISQVESTKMNMLGKSSVCFLVIGVIALVAGIIINNMGILISGAAAILSGGYLYMKGRQATRAEAFRGLSTKIFGEISVISDKISSEWKSFINLQNDNLMKQIVSSSDPADSKVDMIDKIETSPSVNVNLDNMQSDLKGLAAKEDLNGYVSYLSKAYGNIKNAIGTADTAQQGIYNSLAGAK